MTDKKPETTPPAQAPAAGRSTTPGPATTPHAKPSTPASSPAGTKKAGSFLAWAFGIVLLVAILLAAALWYQQQQFKQISVDLASQVQSSSSGASQAVEQARQALSLTQEQTAKIARLEQGLEQSRGHVESLEQAFRTLTDSGSDLILINDVDHLLTIAQQQLQLAGNVANAIISLETAQAQLARANRPGLASLLQTINGDLDRLRAASTIDIALLSDQLDELGALVSEAPLLMPDDAAPNPVAAPSNSSEGRPAPSGNESPAAGSWWEQGLETASGWTRNAWNSIRQDLGQFITVRRVDDHAALLMSPDQATRFRENLRLRIMTAQLALMMRQPKIWKSETDALVKAVESRYDPRSPQTRQALKMARHMADTSIDVKLPTVANSLQAVQALREASAKATENAPTGAGEPARDQAPPAGQPASDADSAPTTSQG
ncbi:MAG TPA: uroporphyrinogen-III C-methyltransferase [Candidimonas sp.]|nr:uroporphyrinogen-III C-methyltransferase [Candidimonas sp.]